MYIIEEIATTCDIIASICYVMHLFIVRLNRALCAGLLASLCIVIVTLLQHMYVCTFKLRLRGATNKITMRNNKRGQARVIIGARNRRNVMVETQFEILFCFLRKVAIVSLDA